MTSPAGRHDGRHMPKTSSIHDPAAQVGAVFVEEFGWLMPAYFGSSALEYQNARQHAALFDISHHGKVEVTGVDAASFTAM